MLFRQETFLVLLTFEFFAIKGGSSQEIAGRFFLYLLKYNVD